MSRSGAPIEYSADESGYICAPFRRTPTASEENDPSEDSDAATYRVSDRSLTPVPPPPAPEHSPRPIRGLRIRETARKRVPLPVRVTLSVPRRDEAESSRPRNRSASPPPATGVPVRPAGMTALESHWVTGLANEMEGCRSTLDLHHQSIDGLMGILNNHSRSLDMMVDTIVSVRRTVRTLRTYLALVMAVLVVVIGLLVQIMMHQ